MPPTIWRGAKYKRERNAMTGYETLSQAARRLWLAQQELCRAAEYIDALAVNDDSLARTIGDDGEYLSASIAPVAKAARAVALKLDRCVLDSIPESVRFPEQERAAG
jgi:hypothetical protein